MKRALLLILMAITLSATSHAPVLALDRPLNATSNALPLLDTVLVHGKIIGINGKRVAIAQTNGTVQTYRISEPRQERYGLTVGSNVTLEVRRLNNKVMTIHES